MMFLLTLKHFVKLKAKESIPILQWAIIILVFLIPGQINVRYHFLIAFFDPNPSIGPALKFVIGILTSFSIALIALLVLAFFAVIRDIRKTGIKVTSKLIVRYVKPSWQFLFWIFVPIVTGGTIVKLLHWADWMKKAKEPLSYKSMYFILTVESWVIGAVIVATGFSLYYGGISFLKFIRNNWSEATELAKAESKK